MDSTLTYFARQGRISDPEAHASLFDDIPASVPELVKLVQGVTIHIFWTDRYGFKAPPERMEEVQLRTMKKRLARTLELDPRPLTEPRPIDRKLIGNCRDHSLLLVAMLRHRGIPARARCGFGTYFFPDHFEDHWVGEYWNAEQNRWILVDAQLDEFQQGTLKTTFDPLDVPRDQFIVAGKAWQMCRSGEHDPEKFGIFDMHGLGFIRGNLVRDTASLNKMELLPWDCWGVILSNSLDDPNDLTALDEIAALSAEDVPDFETLRSRYETDSRFFMSGTLSSYINGDMVKIEIG